MRHTLKIGFVVLVVAALATSGIALALTDDGIEVPEPPDRGGFITERLAPLVEDGTLSESEAEAVAALLAEGFGPGGHGGHGRGPEAVADFLGLTADELRAALEDGSTPGQVAEENGSSTDALVEFLVGEAEARLDEAVAEGRIDEAAKAERMAEITVRITDWVNGATPACGTGPGGHHRPGGAGWLRGGGFGAGEPLADGEGARL